MLEETDLDLLTQELTGVKQKWYEIGVDLGHSSSTLDKIHRESTDLGDCLLELFKYDLEEYPGSTTWRNIVDALRSPDVGDPQLADQLEAKYCPSEFINNNILLYFSEYSVVQRCTRSTPHKV